MLEKIEILEHGRSKAKSKPLKNIIVSIVFSFIIFLTTFILYLNFSYMGASNKELEELIFSNFKLLLVLINLKILLVYFLIGFIIGGFSWLLNIKKKRYILLFNIFFWFIYWIRGIKYYPQLFEDQLFRKGEILKYFQILITDYLPFIAIYIFFIAVIVFIAIINKRIIAGIAILLLSALSIIKFDVSPIENGEGKNTETAPNVLVLATDSLRPQNISYNGYFRKTPNIDRLFAKGINFLNAKASMARTLPSWTSILTSLYPPEHKIRHMFPLEKDLKKNWVTLIDILNKHNYYTAVISDFAGDRFPSIDYGFTEVKSAKLTIQNVLRQRSEEFHYFLLGFIINPIGRLLFPEINGMSLYKDPWYVTNNTKKSIKKAIKKNKPFFIIYFSSNNHFPYVTKYPYYKTFIPRHYNGRHKYGLSFEVMESFLEVDLNKDELQYIIAHYDNATRLFDDNVGELLEYIKKCHIDKNTIVIIMSDHGENLYEKNYGLAHGDHLLGSYANNMVFGIYSPFENFNGRRIKETIRDIDISPTILGLLKKSIPQSFRGKSLVPVLRGADFSGYPAYMETGLWYTPSTPYLKNKPRIPYPDILQMFEVEMPSGNINISNTYKDIVNESKYKAYQLNNKKYIYMPGKNTYKEEYYVNDKLINPEEDQYKELLEYKRRMVNLFPTVFFIDENGFIRENKNN